MVEETTEKPPISLSDSRLQDAIDAIAEGFMLFDAQDRLIAFNGRYRELYDLPEDGLALGVTWSDLLRRCIAEGRYRDAPGREEAFIEERLAQRNGAGESYDLHLSSGRWLRCSDRRTREGGTVSIRADITEEKRREERLAEMEREARENEERMAEIVHANPLPMTITRARDGLVVYANLQAADMVRLPLDKLIGQRSVDFYAREEDRDTVLRQLREKGRVDLLEVQFRRGDGTLFPLALICRPITYRGELAIVAGFQELTDWRRMEETLHQNEKLAALGSLLAGVAHELNNPLSVVLAQTGLIQETTREDATLRRVEKIHVAAQRCARIIRSFLAIARQRPPEYRVVDLDEVIRAALELTGYSLRSNGILVDVDLPDDLPSVWGDSDQLGQVFMNLAVNAQQAMQSCEGPRRLTLSARLDAEEDRVVVRVGDTGPGVPPAIRSRIFDAFFTTKPVGVGTGVGLSVCLGIVATHGGTLTLDETVAEGATFVVTLPAAHSAPDPGPEPAPVTLPQDATWAILVVDDEPDIRQTLAEILATFGGRVDTAANGLEALDLIERRDYDLVISDLRMPELDGPGLYRRLSEHGEHLADRMLFLTGDTLHHELDEFLRTTRAPVLEKPLSAETVRRRVLEFMSTGGR